MGAPSNTLDTLRGCGLCHPAGCSRGERTSLLFGRYSPRAYILEPELEVGRYLIPILPYPFPFLYLEMPPQRNNGFSFVGMVVGVMALLKLKGKYDECVFSYLPGAHQRLMVSI